MWKDFDFVLLLTAILIFGVGLFFLYSASYQHTYRLSGFLPQSFLIRQTIWFGLGLLIGLAFLLIDYRKWLELAFPLYGLGLLLLVLVLMGDEVRLGAQRWITFGNIALQPSEFIKLVTILILARYLGQRKVNQGQALSARGNLPKKELLISFLIVGVPFLLIVKQPDLGTALILVPILFAMLYVWGVRLRTLLLILAGFVLSSPLFWHLLKDYQKSRIMVFLNPNLDPLGAGYTVIQSKIAIGSGRLFGKGWLAGTQNQLNFLPERHTDFIFSVVGEEWGFLGAALLLALYFVLLWRAILCIQNTSLLTGRLLATGITVLLTFQVVINIAMTMGLVPVVGLPLPLVSYGGSSLLSTMIAIALLLNIGTRRTIF
jgi:rod shape determining protein RodA